MINSTVANAERPARAPTPAATENVQDSVRPRTAAAVTTNARTARRASIRVSGAFSCAQNEAASSAPHYSATPDGTHGSSMAWRGVEGSARLPRRCSGDLAQTRNGPMPNSGAIRHTRHQTSASSSVLPEKSCSSGEWSVTTQPAWPTVREQEPRRVAIAGCRASCRARSSYVGSTRGTSAGS
jgi:hypothetical protein